jgi:hypothetical protein
LIQRFGSALNVHFQMLFLGEVSVEHPDGALQFRWRKAQSSVMLARLTWPWSCAFNTSIDEEAADG